MLLMMPELRVRNRRSNQGTLASTGFPVSLQRRRLHPLVMSVLDCHQADSLLLASLNDGMVAEGPLQRPDHFIGIGSGRFSDIWMELRNR